MKQITELQNPDIITINGEKYQVLKHMELFFDDLKKEMSMCLELTKVDAPQISASVRLVYVRERPSEVTLHVYDKSVDRYLESELVSVEL